MSLSTTFWNSSREKVTFRYNNAGTELKNPILEGLQFLVAIRKTNANDTIIAKAGTTSPPTTAITLTANQSDSNLLEYTATAGTSPFIVGKNYVRFTVTSQNGNVAVWEKELYIASLPSDAVQVWDDVNGQWQSVNYATNPSTIPRCSQHCGIRFFNGWQDDFHVVNYGGAEYVSIYDYGTSEGDEEEYYIRRDKDKDITRYEHVYLNKHAVDTVETHDFYVRFKTKQDTTTPAVTVRVRVQSLACFAFNIRDPRTL